MQLAYHMAISLSLLADTFKWTLTYESKFVSIGWLQLFAGNVSEVGGVYWCIPTK